jgi:predicted nucleic acid-binding protein
MMNQTLAPRAEKAFNDCKSGQFLGVISTLTLTEFAGVCQKVEAANYQKMSMLDPKQRSDLVQIEGKKNYEKFLPILLSLPNIKIEQGKNLDLEKILDQARQIMLETKGTINLIKNGDSKVTEFKRAYTADILHALIAKATSCDVLMTLDGEIKKLENHSFVNPLKIITY